MQDELTRNVSKRKEVQVQTPEQLQVASVKREAFGIKLMSFWMKYMETGKAELFIKNIGSIFIPKQADIHPSQYKQLAEELLQKFAADIPAIDNATPQASDTIAPSTSNMKKQQLVIPINRNKQVKVVFGCLRAIEAFQQMDRKAFALRLIIFAATAVCCDYSCFRNTEEEVCA